MLVRRGKLCIQLKSDILGLKQCITDVRHTYYEKRRNFIIWLHCQDLNCNNNWWSNQSCKKHQIKLQTYRTPRKSQAENILSKHKTKSLNTSNTAIVNGSNFLVDAIHLKQFKHIAMSILFTSDTYRKNTEEPVEKNHSMLHLIWLIVGFFFAGLVTFTFFKLRKTCKYYVFYLYCNFLFFVHLNRNVWCSICGSRPAASCKIVHNLLQAWNLAQTFL